MISYTIVAPFIDIIYANKVFQEDQHDKTRILIILVLACSLLIHLLQSRVAAIVLAAYAVLNVVVTSVSNGRFSGWWVALVGVYAVIYTFKFQKAWKDYQNDNAE